MTDRAPQPAPHIENCTSRPVTDGRPPRANTTRGTRREHHATNGRPPRAEHGGNVKRTAHTTPARPETNGTRATRGEHVRHAPRPPRPPRKGNRTDVPGIPMPLTNIDGPTGPRKEGTIMKKNTTNTTTTTTANTNTNTPATNTTPATKNSANVKPFFAVAVSNLYARNTSRGLDAKERRESLGGGDTFLAYRVACYKARKACAAYVLAMADDTATAANVNTTRSAFYDALRVVYSFSGARVNAVDGVKLPGLFAVRMDTVKRVKVRADVVTADGASVDTYEKRRVCVEPSDAVWFAALENMAGSRLAGVDIHAAAALAYANIADAPATAAKRAPRPEGTNETPAPTANETPAA